MLLFFCRVSTFQFSFYSLVFVDVIFNYISHIISPEKNKKLQYTKKRRQRIAISIRLS